MIVLSHIIQFDATNAMLPSGTVNFNSPTNLSDLQTALTAFDSTVTHYQLLGGTVVPNVLTARPKTTFDQRDNFKRVQVNPNFEGRFSGVEALFIFPNTPIDDVMGVSIADPHSWDFTTVTGLKYEPSDRVYLSLAALKTV
jgi:hypothetical protein